MLYFLFDNKWIEVSPDSYVTPVATDSRTCIFFLMPASLPMNIIGMPAFIDYYTMHDPETGTIEFAPHTVSNKQPLKAGRDRPSEQMFDIGSKIDVSVN